MFYLAGDIGGTNTRLVLYFEKDKKWVKEKSQNFSSQDHPNLCTIVKEFVGEEHYNIEHACFGIAGPVKDGKIHATNLPWVVDSEILQNELRIKKVSLINDLEANAYGLNVLSDEDFFVLNPGNPHAQGNRAMVSAGTGLGEAGIFFDGENHYPFACEGGHVDFAPRNEEEDALLRYLRGKFQHVSYERILSGPGLFNIYQFLIDTKMEQEDPVIHNQIMTGDSPKIISEKGLDGSSKACLKTLEMFVSIYGSEAGNVALKMFATGGIFLGGGIAPKILSEIKHGTFLNSFIQKGRFSALLADIPIRVVLNDHAALLGAAYYAKHNML